MKTQKQPYMSVDKKYEHPLTATKLPPIEKIKEIRAQVRAQVRDQVRAQVRDQVGAQVRVCGYFAIKEFFNLTYEHPAFELIRLGILVVKIKKICKVFGKNGIFLGEFDE